MGNLSEHQGSVARRPWHLQEASVRLHMRLTAYVVAMRSSADWESEELCRRRTDLRRLADQADQRAELERGLALLERRSRRPTAACR